MAYTIKSSERTRASGAEFETKALLYLMGSREDSNEIFYFVVDFFNDLTGLDRFSKKAWDIQSKGAKNNSPGAIGRELVTLYKNYLSELEFDFFILFLGGVSDSISAHLTENIFTVSSLDSSIVDKMVLGLIKECKDKSYIDDSDADEEKIKRFLANVIFVVDDKESGEYIRGIIGKSVKNSLENKVLCRIFNEIRDAQSAKKNNGNVEGIVVQGKEDFLQHQRYITSDEIQNMVMHRIIGYRFMETGVTKSFIPIYNSLPEDDREDRFQRCQNKLALTYADKNNTENFWELVNHISEVLQSNPLDSIDEAYKKLDNNILERVHHLETLSLKYFMSLIKDVKK